MPWPHGPALWELLATALFQRLSFSSTECLKGTASLTRSEELLRLAHHLFHCGLGLTDGRHIC